MKEPSRIFLVENNPNSTPIYIYLLIREQRKLIITMKNCLKVSLASPWREAVT
jgi:hypothetical protein